MEFRREARNGMVNMIAQMFRRRASKDGCCDDIFRRASAFVEHDLDSETVGLLQRHLDRCAPCQAFIDTLARTIEALKRVPSQPVPPDARERLMARLHDERR